MKKARCSVNPSDGPSAPPRVRSGLMDAAHLPAAVGAWDQQGRQVQACRAFVPRRGAALRVREAGGVAVLVVRRQGIAFQDRRGLHPVDARRTPPARAVALTLRLGADTERAGQGHLVHAPLSTLDHALQPHPATRASARRRTRRPAGAQVHVLAVAAGEFSRNQICFGRDSGRARPRMKCRGTS